MKRKENRQIIKLLAGSETPGTYGSLKLANVLVRFNHVASFIVNANYGIV